LRQRARHAICRRRHRRGQRPDGRLRAPRLAHRGRHRTINKAARMSTRSNRPVSHRDAPGPAGGPAKDEGGSSGGAAQPRARAPKSARKQHRASSGWDTIKTIIYAVLVAMVVRTLLIEPFSIPSRSMLPTLQVGDYLFVSKFSYGYSKYSLPFSLPLFSGRILFHPPKRGDVAVFKKPTDNKTDYIKRIIGLPGDRIQVKAGRLYINGTIVPRKSLGEYIDVKHEYGGVRERYMSYLETLPNGVSHVVLERGDDVPYVDNTEVYVVPKGHYFMMGDNRDNSQDSRYLSLVGFVPAENLVGRADFMFFSLREDKRWWEIWEWPAYIRWSRVFMSVK
jgi:signal peptidase I